MTAYSPTSYTGDGSTTDFTVSWPYLDADHVECFLDGVETSLFSIPSTGLIRFNSAPGASVAITIKRNTPIDPIAVWNDGAVILGADLNTAFNQSLYISEEAEVRANESIALDATTTWWEANSKEIRNVVDPTLAQSVATKNYVDTSSDSQVAAAAASAAAAAASAAIVTTVNGKNYIVNPSFNVSQQNGQTASTANNFYPADQTLVAFSHSGTTTAQNITANNTSGTKNRIRITVTAGDASPAASNYFLLMHPLEGSRIADLGWGTSNVKDVVVRFGFKGPAGTYAVSIRNAALDRSFVREFTISGGDANTDTIQTFIFPGDTLGTWADGNTLGMTLSICLATGSTFQSTADAWQAGNYLGTSSTSNGIGATSDVFEVWDLGMYADPDGIGVAPIFEAPHLTEALIDCKRYYEILTLYPDYNDGISNTALYRNYELSVEKMLSSPSVAVSTQIQYYSGGTPTNITPNGLYASQDAVSVQLTGLTAGRGIYNGGVAINSRM